MWCFNRELICVNDRWNTTNIWNNCLNSGGATEGKLIVNKMVFKNFLSKTRSNRTIVFVWYLLNFVLLPVSGLLLVLSLFSLFELKKFDFLLIAFPTNGLLSRVKLESSCSGPCIHSFSFLHRFLWWSVTKNFPYSLLSWIHKTCDQLFDYHRLVL